MKSDCLSKYFYLLLVVMTIAKKFVDISPSLMVFISTGSLVYIGCILSSKVLLNQSNNGSQEKIETMKQKDAWLFPVIGSVVLFGLYIVFKYLQKDMLNLLLQIYFSLLGAYTISALIQEKIYTISPFKSMYENKLFTIPKIKLISDSEVIVTLLDILTFCLGSVVAIFYFIYKNWVFNNILGMAFSIFGIANMILGEYKTGAILLILLFFYDIFWVFFTPVMVSVAKSIDGPIKLMFPKHFSTAEIKDFNNDRTWRYSHSRDICGADAAF